MNVSLGVRPQTDLSATAVEEDRRTDESNGRWSGSGVEQKCGGEKNREWEKESKHTHTHAYYTHTDQRKLSNAELTRGHNRFRRCTLRLPDSRLLPFHPPGGGGSGGGTVDIANRYSADGEA